MARASHLWAIVAALFVCGVALGQSSWPVQVVDTAPSGICSSTVYKGAVVVRDTALMWRCIDPDNDGVGLWSQIREVRYMDFDTDGDAAEETRIVGDYDGDGTLEIQDLQSALDGLCDSDSDGTQDRTQTIDSDGDSTVDDAIPYCGRLIILPGHYVGGDATSGKAAELTVKWSGLTIEGSGRLATILRSGFPYAKLFSRTCGVGGIPCGSPSFTHVVNIANGTNMMRRITLKNLRIEGISGDIRRDKCTTYSCSDGFDADGDGTTDGAQHGVNVNNPDDVIIEDVHVHNADRIAFLWGTDTSVYESQVGTLTFNRVRTDGNLGEHCMAGSPVYLQVLNSHLEGCDWEKINGKAIEYIVYDGDNVGPFGLQIVGNWIASGTNGIRVFPASGLTGGPHAFNWKRFNISGNTFMNSGMAISVESSVGTSASSFNVSNIAITGNTFTKPLVYSTPIGGGFVNIQETGNYGTIDGVTVTGNQFDQDSTASLGSGQNSFQHVNVAGADSVAITGNSFIVYGNNSTTGSTEEQAISVYNGQGASVTGNSIRLNGGGVEGIKLNTVTYAVVSGNSIAGVEYPAAQSGWQAKHGIELLNVTNSLISGNEIGRTKSGIYMWGSGGNIQNNTITGNRCRITGICAWLDAAGTNTNNTISYNSAADCDPDGTGSVTTNTYAWYDGESAGSNLWVGNTAQACWEDGDTGSASANVAAGHGSTWVLDSDLDSNPDYDSATWLRFNSLSGIDSYWDTGIRFRNTAGTYFTTLEGFEPYQNATVQFINATGIVPVTPGPSVPTSQCAEWNSSAYLVGTGSPCATGDVTAVGPGCSTGECFTDGKATPNTTTMFIWEGPTVDDYEFQLSVPSADPTEDYLLRFPSYSGNLVATVGTSTSICAEWDADGMLTGTATLTCHEKTNNTIRVGNGSTALSVTLPDCDGDGSTLNYDQTTHAFSCGDDDGGTGGSPGGTDTQFQFNDSSAFGGSSGLTYNKTTGVVSSGTLDSQIIKNTDVAGWLWKIGSVTNANWKITGTKISNEGATENDYETTLSFDDPTVDAEIRIPNAGGIFPVAAGPNFPTTQCATWDGSGYIGGTGSPCADPAKVEGSDKVELDPDSDSDGTGVIETYGMFSNEDSVYTTAFRFDANSDGASDVELTDDGTNSGIVLRNGTGFIQYGVAARLKVKLCTTDVFFFYDEDNDGTYDSADDFCYGKFADNDCDCNEDTAPGSTQVDIDGDGTREINLASQVLSFDPSEDGTADLILDGTDDEIRIDLDNDGTLEFKFDLQEKYFCLDPDDNANCDFMFVDEGSDATPQVGIRFHGAAKPTIMHDDNAKSIYFDYDEDGTYDLTIDGSAAQVTIDPNSDGTADMLLNQTFLQTDQIRYSSTSSARMTATNGRMHMCGGNQFAPTAAAGACMYLGGSTGTYASTVGFDPDGDGTDEATINNLGVYSGQATTAGALATDPTGCTNQFVTDMAAAGALTCNPVSGGYVTDGSLLAADLSWDSTATRTAGQLVTVGTDTTKFLAVTKPALTLNFTGATAVCNLDPPLFKAPYAMTITAIHCAVWAATSFPLSVEECDGNIGSCAGVDGATTITCDTDGATDDGSLSNASIDSGDWIKLNFGSASGTPAGATVTIYYTTP